MNVCGLRDDGTETNWKSDEKEGVVSDFRSIHGLALRDISLEPNIIPIPRKKPENRD